MSLLRRPSLAGGLDPLGGAAGRGARWLLWPGLLVLLLVAGACNTGAYPVDIFTEMHYQPSQRRLEPHRLAPAPGAVPVQGRGERPASPGADAEAGAATPILTFAEAASLSNPLAATSEVLEGSRALYRVNCATCHGEGGRGDGPVAAYFGRTPQAPVPPTDLTSERVRQRSDGELYWIITFGLGNMPPFGDLLTDQERWQLVHWIRQVQGRS